MQYRPPIRVRVRVSTIFIEGSMQYRPTIRVRVRVSTIFIEGSMQYRPPFYRRAGGAKHVFKAMLVMVTLIIPLFEVSVKKVRTYSRESNLYIDHMIKIGQDFNIDGMSRIFMFYFGILMSRIFMFYFGILIFMFYFGILTEIVDVSAV